MLPERMLCQNEQVSPFSCLSMKVSAAPPPLPSPSPAAAPPRPRALLGPLGQLGDLDLRLLRVYRTIVECGGLTAAELELNIGASTVSRHLKDLETRLGLVLCRRGRAGFAVTAEGQRIYDETLRLLASLDAFRSSVDDIHLRMGGQLEVALFDKTVTNPACRIAAAVARFNAAAPEVRLSLSVAPMPAIERGILDGSLQVGVIPAHRSSRSLVYEDLFDETMLLYCGVGHPLFARPAAKLTWAGLRDHAFAGLGYHSPNMALSHRAQLLRQATASDQEAIATLVLSGRFLGFLPDHYATAFEREGRLRAIRPDRFQYLCRFVSVMRRSPQPSRAAQLFVRCLGAAHQVHQTDQDHQTRQTRQTSAGAS